MNRIIIILFVLGIAIPLSGQKVVDTQGALIRSDTLERSIYLCFTGHDFTEGFGHVMQVLKRQKIQASFFLTGDFVRSNINLTKRLVDDGHFVGTHSDKHLLYCDWSKRDSLLHPPDIIRADISNNLKALENIGIHPTYFMPPFEWYNAEVVAIAKELNQVTVNFSPGTRSNADYTSPDMSNYISSADILKSIYDYEKQNGMNGFHLLMHPGTSPLRKDKLYLHLDRIITDLKREGYHFNKF